MHAEHNSPDNSGTSYPKQQSEVRNQKSGTGGPGAPGEHVCPLDRNCRARCLAWESGGLPAALRWFSRHHNWHDPGRMTNQVKLRLVFKKPIHKAVNTMLADRLDGLTAKIEKVFSNLQHHAETLDDLRITDEDELVMLEHTMAYLDEGLGDLADLIEGGEQPPAVATGYGGASEKTRKARKIIEIPADSQRPAGTPAEQWVTMSEAAGLLEVAKSTVSKWSKKGWFADNGLAGLKKRLSKVSVLLVRQQREDQALQQDVRDLREDGRRLGD